MCASPTPTGSATIGEGWKVAQTTLMNERVSIGGSRLPREGGMIGPIAATWRERPELRTHDLHQRLLTLWVEAEVARLAGERLRQQLAAGQPGPEGSGMKLAFARLNQEISGLEVELLGEEGLLYERLDHAPPRIRRLHRARRRLPLSALQGQLASRAVPAKCC